MNEDKYIPIEYLEKIEKSFRNHKVIDDMLYEQMWNFLHRIDALEEKIQGCSHAPDC